MKRHKLYDSVSVANFQHKVIILAPHPDDELIGCYSLLESRTVDYVAYFNELTDSRKAEALRCAKQYEFTPLFIESAQDTEQLELLLAGSYVFVPAITDEHPDHKALNSKYRSFPGAYATRFYSVDMGSGKTVLTEDQRGFKWLALDTLYPSQQGLWATNASYYLFEHIRDCDLGTRQKLSFLMLRNRDHLTVIAPSTVDETFLVKSSNESNSLEELANKLISAGIFSFHLETHDRVINL